MCVIIQKIQLVVQKLVKMKYAKVAFLIVVQQLVNLAVLVVNAHLINLVVIVMGIKNAQVQENVLFFIALHAILEFAN